MNRPRILLVGGLLLLGGCKVERTPREYFDHARPAEVVQREAAEELRDRVLAFGQALVRGDELAAQAALAPAPDGYLLGPLDGQVLQGGERIAALVRRLAALGPLAVDVLDVHVGVGPRASVGWFAARFQVPGLPDSAGLRMTGVYVRDRGDWRLVQGHLSLAATGLPALPGSPYPDSAAAPAADAAAAAAPASPPGGTSAAPRSPAESAAAPRVRRGTPPR